MAGGPALAGGVTVSGVFVVDVAVVTLTGDAGGVPSAGIELVTVLPGDCVLNPPLQVLARHTEAFAFTGAFADVLFAPPELCVAV